MANITAKKNYYNKLLRYAGATIRTNLMSKGDEWHFTLTFQALPFYVIPQARTTYCYLYKDTI